MRGHYLFDHWNVIKKNINAANGLICHLHEKPRKYWVLHSPADHSVTFDPGEWVRHRESLHHTRSIFQCKAVTPLFSSNRKLPCNDPVTTLETTSSFVMILYGLTTSIPMFSSPWIQSTPHMLSNLLTPLFLPSLTVQSWVVKNTKIPKITIVYKCSIKCVLCLVFVWVVGILLVLFIGLLDRDQRQTLTFSSCFVCWKAWSLFHPNTTQRKDLFKAMCA